jgi:hypothetical protein
MGSLCWSIITHCSFPMTQLSRSYPAFQQSVATGRKHVLASEPLPASVHIPPHKARYDDAQAPISQGYECQEPSHFSFQEIVLHAFFSFTKITFSSGFGILPSNNCSTRTATCHCGKHLDSRKAVRKFMSQGNTWKYGAKEKESRRT